MTATAPTGTTTGYSPLSKAIHWIMAAFVLAIIPIGLTMTRLPPGKLQDNLFFVHESFGATILALACIRVAVRLIRGVPAPYPGLEPWQRIAAAASHHLLYVLIFVVPLLGWAGASAYRSAISVYGVFELPPILPVNKPVAETIFIVHIAAAYLMTAVVALHIGAALMHGFVKRDGVLGRMLPEGWGDRLTMPVAARREDRRAQRST
ncbi:MAG: cytochrome b [Gemmatimonas sp.]